MIDNLIGLMGVGALFILIGPLFQTAWLKTAASRLGLFVFSLSSGLLIGSVWMGAQ